MFNKKAPIDLGLLNILNQYSYDITEPRKSLYATTTD